MVEIYNNDSLCQSAFSVRDFLRNPEKTLYDIIYIYLAWRGPPGGYLRLPPGNIVRKRKKKNLSNDC